MQGPVRLPLAALRVCALETPLPRQIRIELGDVVGGGGRGAHDLADGHLRLRRAVRQGVVVVLDHDVLAPVRADEDRRGDVPPEVEGTEEVAAGTELEQVPARAVIAAVGAVQDVAVRHDRRGRA